MARDRGVLSQPEFRRLFVAVTTSSLGNGLLPVALVFGVIEAGGRASDVGLVMAAGLLPAVTLTLIGGVWADRIARRTIMVVSDGVQFVVQTVSALLLLTGEVRIGHLVALQFTSGLASAFFTPALTGVIPHTVPPDRLQRANALLSASRDAGYVVGPMIAGVIVTLGSAGIAIAIDAATFLVSMVAAGLMRVGTVGLGSEAEERLSLVRELREGWSMVRERKWLLTELVRSAFDLPLVVAPFMILGPIIAEDRLGGAGAWTLVLSGFSAGTFIGAIVAARWRVRRPMLVGTTLMYLTAAPPLVLAFTDSAPLVAGTETVRGAAVGLFGAMWASLLQQEIPDRARSRVNAWDIAITNGTFPVGLVIAAPLSSILGERPLLVLSGAWALVSVSLALLVPEIRNLRLADPEPPAVAAGPDSNGHDETGAGVAKAAAGRPAEGSMGSMALGSNQ